MDVHGEGCPWRCKGVRATPASLRIHVVVGHVKAAVPHRRTVRGCMRTRHAALVDTAARQSSWMTLTEIMPMRSVSMRSGGQRGQVCSRGCVGALDNIPTTVPCKATSYTPAVAFQHALLTSSPPFLLTSRLFI